MNDIEPRRYVLVTAAHNEEGYIEALIRSVVEQDLKPLRWVIVSDGSTDRTDEIVQRYAAQHEFIRLRRIAEDHPRNFAAQVSAINAGLSLLQNAEYEFIGNLDADISLPPSYFHNLLQNFHKNPRLGLGGGYLYEQSSGRFKLREGTTSSSVPHGVQCFRRECLAAIGGEYIAFPYGGPDMHAEVMARMNGWTVEAFPDLKAYHHRPTGLAGGTLRYCFRQGLMDYSLGLHPLFEILRLLARVPTKPYLLGSLLRFSGFSYAALQGHKILVSDEFMKYSQREQLKRCWPFRSGM